MARGHANTARDSDTSARIGGVQGIHNDIEQNTLHLVSIQGNRRETFPRFEIQSDAFDEGLVFHERNRVSDEPIDIGGFPIKFYLAGEIEKIFDNLANALCLLGDGFEV
jgi:hypothetical protein